MDTQPQIISRAEAQAQGLKHYFTGKPCKHGHVSARIRANGNCSTCYEAYQRDYLRKWKTENPQKVVSYRLGDPRAYQRTKAWRQKNPDRVSLHARRRVCQMRISSFDHERDDVRRFYQNCPSGKQVDHEVPLKHPLVCGLHVLANLQYLTVLENSQKSNKWEPCW